MTAAELEVSLSEGNQGDEHTAFVLIYINRPHCVYHTYRAQNICFLRNVEKGRKYLCRHIGRMTEYYL